MVGIQYGAFPTKGNTLIFIQVANAFARDSAIPGGSGKESACNAGDLGSTLGQEDSWRREWLPTPVFLP